MHAVVRRYQRASALNDLRAQRSQEVEQLMRDPGGMLSVPWAIAPTAWAPPTA